MSAPRILLLAMLPIGDTLFMAPTVRALRARHPAARLVALGYASNAPLLGCLPELDAVLTLPALGTRAGQAEMSRLLWRLRAERWQVAVDFTSPAYKWIPLLAGIWRRTYLPFDRLWWILPRRHARWRQTHASELYYDCARGLDLPPWATVDHRPCFTLPATARERAWAFLRAQGCTPDAEAKAGREDAGQVGPLVALHPGGMGLAGRKRWPAERFAAVADRLVAEHGARIVLLGGSDETAVTRAVAAAMRAPALDAAGTLPLLATFALLATCALFIGNDSSLLHAAAAQGTPYVGIFGPTCLANFQPIPRRPRQGRLVAPWPPCPRPSYFIGGQPIWQRPRCDAASGGLLSITTEQVLAQAEELLRG